jgi:FLYWCH zinc finger domain
MADRKVAHGQSSKGRKTVIFRNFEYVKHREYFSKEIQWRCRLYTSYECLARLRTNGDMVVGDAEPVHNHDCNPVGIAARNAVATMKEHFTNVSGIPVTVIGNGVLNLSYDVLMVVPKRAPLKRRLQRSRITAGIERHGGAVGSALGFGSKHPSSKDGRDNCVETLSPQRVTAVGKLLTLNCLVGDWPSFTFILTLLSSNCGLSVVSK